MIHSVARKGISIFRLGPSEHHWAYYGMVYAIQPITTLGRIQAEGVSINSQYNQAVSGASYLILLALNTLVHLSRSIQLRMITILI